MKKIAVFASGTGSNALNLIEATKLRSDAEIRVVIVDNPASALPEIIKKKYPQIPVFLIEPISGLDKKKQKIEFETRILKILEESKVEWIFLAGYMRIVGPTLLNIYKNKIINIHPSLLPLYPGIRSYERAFNDHVSESGVTLHLVDEGMDTGPILMQEKFYRSENDTIEDFIKKGKEIEWRIYPKILERLSKIMIRYYFIIASEEASIFQLYWVESSRELNPDEINMVKRKLGDSVDQEVYSQVDGSFFSKFFHLTPLTITFFRPGVTDNPAKSVQELLCGLSFFKNVKLEVHSGIISKARDFNPLIQNQISIDNFSDFKKISEMDFSLNLDTVTEISTYPILDLNSEELLNLSRINCWALSDVEMMSIKTYFKNLNRHATDVEMEMLAQTWSEHCKHKIFNAEIDYRDEKQNLKIKSLFKEFIKAPTYDLKKSWAISLFDDNAGVVRFRKGMDLCIKVETHNSPSALDPYGGALTGILGVNRDIMGTGLGAKPVANTDVFCVGLPDEGELPNTLLHPTKILEGIHHGVQDGGNKSGIPTVNGAIYFDESYSGKPLVYCGTIGLIPPEIQGITATQKGQRPGDFIVMVGGDVGIDGIHGATASSLVMDKSTTIGMVQIGDPFSQKRMLDFILAARDKLLYNSITDNGAGGLSSSVGEMCSVTNGALVNLEVVPLKYPGLKPWQILVSESQERMTLSVPPENWEQLRDLAQLYDVKVTHIGEFTNSGKFICHYNGAKVCDLDLSFLHDGLPKMNLKATFKGEYKSWKKKVKKNIPLNRHDIILKDLLKNPSLASKEKWIRQYDHEVQGGTVVKPLEGLHHHAPNNAGVLWYGAYGLDGYDGFAVASGLCPHFSIDDTHLMAKMAVDESVRNLLCHGVDPDKIALVDNFCWPDPTPSPRNPDAEFKLSQLVRACMGLKEMMECYQMPLVSGKDSMKNDYHGEKLKISVLPTLLITALGHVPDVRSIPRSQAEEGDLIYRLGLKDYSHYFGHYLHDLADLPRMNNRDFEWGEIRQMYNRVFEATKRKMIGSLHDISDGGFLPSLVENLMLNQLGIEFHIKGSYQKSSFLYSELPGHFIVSIKKEKKALFEEFFKREEYEFIGETNGSGKIIFEENTLDINELASIWRNP